jgi:NIMA (never in mitosis gene a)-related kinase 1/4/5
MKQEVNFNNYKILGKLGRGSFAIVYKVEVDNKIFALKQIELNVAQQSGVNMKYIENEVELLSSLNCDYIVKYYASYKESEINLDENSKDLARGKFNIFMEYCDSGDLSDLIDTYKKTNKPIEDDKLVNIFTQITQGLDYLHSKKILHRDLKTMNVLLCSDGRVKLSDLGVAKFTGNSLANTIVGTPYYLSPEMCEEKPYNEKTDIWSLGCILYELLTLKKPFDSTSHLGLIMKIAKGKYESIHNVGETKNRKELISLVSRLLIKNPVLRLNTREIIKILDVIKASDIKRQEIRRTSTKKNTVSSVPSVKKAESFTEGSSRVRMNPKDKVNQVTPQLVRIF